MQKEISIISTQQESRLDSIIVICPPYDTNMPPLGLAYLMSGLSKQKISSRLVDMNIDMYNLSKGKYKSMWLMENYKEWADKDFHKTIISENLEMFEESINNILKKRPAVIGFSVNAANFKFTTEVIKKIKSADSSIKICLGGPFSKPIYLKYHEIKEYIEVAVIGEESSMLPMIINAVKKNEEISGLEGTFTEEGILFISASVRHDNLSHIQFPTFDEFDLAKYEMKSLPILASLGCRFRCKFCSDWKQNNGKYMWRNPEDIVNEIVHHYLMHGIRRFEFQDLLLNGDLVSLGKLCELIIERDLQIEWTCMGYVNPKMDDGLLSKMAKAGCIKIVFGVESCSDKVLALMNKPYRRKDMNILFPRLKKAGIGCYINLIVGFPGEDEKEFNETCRYIDENADLISGISSLNPCLILKDDSILSSELIKNNISYDRIEDYAEWKTADNSNNYEIRKDRLNKIAAIANKRGIDIFTYFKMDETIQKQLGMAKGQTPNKPIAKTAVSNKIAGEAIADKFRYAIKNKKNIIRDSIQSAKVAGGILNKKAITGPWTVQIDIMNNCNNDCVGCWCHSPLLGELAMQPDVKKKFIETGLALRLFRELHEMGVRDIYFTGGGEPFMHPDAVKIMCYVKKLGMRCDMSTNFTLCSEAKIDALIGAGVDNMNCSIWAGSPEGFVRTHPNKSASTFEQLKKRLFYLSHAKKKKGKTRPNIQIYNVISTLNYDDFENMVEFAYQERANGLDFTPTDNVPGKTDCLMLNDSQRLWLLDKIKKIPLKIREWERYYNHRLTFLKLGNMRRRMESSETEKGQYDKNIIGTFPCYAGFSFLRILGDGSVNSCLKSQNIPIGNIHEQSIKDIWNNSKQDEFRRHTIDYNLDDPYFNNIGNRYQKGNGCLLCCDNLEFNQVIHKKLTNANPLIRKALSEYGKYEIMRQKSNR